MHQHNYFSHRPSLAQYSKSQKNGLLIDWFYNPKNVQDNIFEKIVLSLFDHDKITRHSYSILKETDKPIDTERMMWIGA